MWHGESEQNIGFGDEAADDGLPGSKAQLSDLSERRVGIFWRDGKDDGSTLTVSET